MNFDTEERKYNIGYEKALRDCGVHTVPGCDCVAGAKVFGLKSSIKRAKYPSSPRTEILDSELTPVVKALAQSRKGGGQDQWLTGVVVQFDLIFTVKTWIEAERYNFLDFVGSQSSARIPTKEDFIASYNRYVDGKVIDIMREKTQEYENLIGKRVEVIANGDYERERLLDRQISEKYLEILYNNPSGFKLTAGITTNYRQLKTIYSQRKDSKNPEWAQFCRWIRTLPMSELITQGGE